MSSIGKGRLLVALIAGLALFALVAENSRRDSALDLSQSQAPTALPASAAY